jgi:hypothetical protein
MPTSHFGGFNLKIKSSAKFELRSLRDGDAFQAIVSVFFDLIAEAFARMSAELTHERTDDSTRLMLYLSARTEKLLQKRSPQVVDAHLLPLPSM